MQYARRMDTRTYGLSERAVYYHRLLGVPVGAGRDAIKRAYRAQARLYHPDVNPAGHDRMRLLNEAYQHLEATIL